MHDAKVFLITKKFGNVKDLTERELCSLMANFTIERIQALAD